MKKRTQRSKKKSAKYYRMLFKKLILERKDFRYV